MNQFNYLPSEIIEFIFQKVNFNDLVNLRIVDKRFKEICEQIKIKQLLLSNNNRIMINNYDECDYLPKLWFYTNDPTYSKNENLVQISKFLNYRSIFELNKYLKRLSIRANRNENFNLSILNEFKLLEQLDMYLFELNNNYKLSLDNLKIAYIYFRSNFSSTGCTLTLDTNKLFAFKSLHNQPGNFIFNYPDKILFYETNYVYESDSIFNNLQHLKLINLETGIRKNFLIQFENLKILDLNFNLETSSSYTNFYFKHDIIEIFNEKENLKRTNLHIYLHGVELIHQDEISRIDCLSGRNEAEYNIFEFQINNYGSLKENTYQDKMNYCNLIKLIKIVPSSFTNKFPNIHKVYANDHIDNEDQFIEFLNNLPYFSNLKLINCGLTQSFFDKLINLVYLNDLEFFKIEDKIDLKINFDFILNLKQLIEFETNQTIIDLVDLATKLFKENKNIKKFVAKIDTKHYIDINIDKGIETYYKFDTNVNDRIEGFNLENAISKLKKNLEF